MVGGGNTAVEEALYLTNHAEQRDADPSPRHAARREDPAGPAVRQSEDQRGLGQRRRGGRWARRAARACTGVRLAQRQDRRDHASSPVDGVFVAIGHTPATELFKRPARRWTREGYIVTRPDSTATAIPGVFAAGDVQGQDVPPGGDRRRHGLHGGARGGEVPGAQEDAGERNAASAAGHERRPNGDGLGQAAGLPRRRRGRQLHPCRRGARTSASRRSAARSARSRKASACRCSTATPAA